MEKYENINLNLIEPNVLSDFIVIKHEDNSVRLVRYQDNSAVKVAFKESYKGYDGAQRFELTVPKENRTVEAVAVIMRTSHNCYIVVASDLNKSSYKRCTNAEEVSSFLKSNYCRTLF